MGLGFRSRHHLLLAAHPQENNPNSLGFCITSMDCICHSGLLWGSSAEVAGPVAGHRLLGLFQRSELDTGSKLLSSLLIDTQCK